MAEAGTERIDRTDEDWWVCPCGNDPGRDGFFPCDRRGEEVEPTPAAWQEPLYRCARCGRIIEQETGLVIRGTTRRHPKRDNRIGSG